MSEPVGWLDWAQVNVDWVTSKLWPGETIEEAALALCEEAGEVARAVIKRAHSARGEGDRAAADWSANLRVELAQVVIVAMKMAEREGFQLSAAITEQMGALHDRHEAKVSEGPEPSATVPTPPDSAQSDRVFLGASNTPLIDTTWPVTTGEAF